MQSPRPNIVALRGNTEGPTITSAEQGPLFRLLLCSSAGSQRSTHAKPGSSAGCQPLARTQNEVSRGRTG